jgi:hypothetical protein
MLRAITIMLLALSLAALSACKDDSAEEFSKTVVVPIERAERAADSANLSALSKSVEAYRATNGRYPESLDELGTGIDTSRFDYDPATGKVTLKK